MVRGLDSVPPLPRLRLSNGLQRRPVQVDPHQRAEEGRHPGQQHVVYIHYASRGPDRPTRAIYWRPLHESRATDGTY